MPIQSNRDVYGSPSSNINNSISSASIKSTTFPRTTIADIPLEIMGIIISYLNRTDLFVCAIVSRRMREAARPLQYKNVKMGHRSILEHFKRSPEFRKDICKNANRIRQIRIQGGWIEPLFSPLKHSNCSKNLKTVESHDDDDDNDFRFESHIDCVDLNSVVCRKVKKVLVTYPLYRRALHQCLDSALRVTALLLSNPITSLILTYPQRARIALDLLLACPKLEYISVDYEMYPPAVTYLLQAMPPFIRYIRLLCGVSSALQLEHSSDAICGAREEGSASQKKRRHLAQLSPPTSRPKLAGLQIQGKFTGFEEDILFPFLDTCSPTVLVDFRCPDTFLYLTESLIVSMARFGKYLRHLNDADIDLAGTPAREVDEAIADIISMNHRLVGIAFGSVSNVGTATAEAIAGSARISRVDVKGCRGMSSIDLIHILENTHELTTFVSGSDLSQGSFQVNTKDPWIDAVDVRKTTTWASSQVSVFECNISAPRVYDDVPCNAQLYLNSVASYNQEICHSFQRNAFQFLGVQVSLTRLSLGQGRAHFNRQLKRPIFQWYSMDMTLAGGLDELVDLKNLFLFDVGFTNHHIGVAELRWMAKNWPSLREFYGLFSNGRRTKSTVLVWVKKHDPIWVKPLLNPFLF